MLIYMYTYRYGNVFKSHILGCPTVISMDPVLNRYILLNESKGLVPGYPQSSLDILGKHNVAAVTGSDHRQIRGPIMSLVGPSAVKEQLWHRIDKNMGLFLQNWDGKIIDIQQKSQEVIFITLLSICVSYSCSDERLPADHL